jgi:hypothetical protein
MNGKQEFSSSLNFLFIISLTSLSAALIIIHRNKEKAREVVDRSG